MMAKCFVSYCNHIEDLGERRDLVQKLKDHNVKDGDFYLCSKCNGMNVIEEAYRRHREMEEKHGD